MGLTAGIPTGWLVLGATVIAAASYLWESHKLLRRSLEVQHAARSAAINPTALSVVCVEQVIMHPLTIAHVRLEADGVYLRIPDCWVLAPARAFRDGAAAAFVAIYQNAVRPSWTIRQPAGQIDGYPWAITFQQTKEDARHAFLSGMAGSFLRSRQGRTVFIFCALPIPVCLMLVALMRGALAEALLVGVTISILFAAIGICYIVSPALSRDVVNSRRPFRQPLTVGLGPLGVAVNDGARTSAWRWRTVRKIAADDRLIVIAMKTDFLLIPRNAFHDDAMAGDFVAAAQAYQRGEAPAAPPVTWPPAPDKARA